MSERYLLVAGSGEYQQETVVCAHHLAARLKRSPLKYPEAVYAADAGLACEDCGKTYKVTTLTNTQLAKLLGEKVK